jgi:multiple sugar transport system permease protein
MQRLNIPEGTQTLTSSPFLAVMGKKIKKRTLFRNLEGYLFAAPWIIGFLVFTLGPFFSSIWYSFNQWDMVTESKFIGLLNYSNMLKNDLFWKSISVTARYVLLSLPAGLLLALLLAILVNKQNPIMMFFRGVFFLPSVTSGVAVAILWRWLFNPEFGLINYMLAFFHIQGPAWLSSQYWALPAIAIMSLWGVGSTMLIYLAGLQSVPQHLYEAAEIDGASLLQRFWSVTLPMMSPTIFFTLVMGMIGSLQAFTQSYIMTRGGPNFATYFYVLNLYEEAFIKFRMGYASAMAWVLFITVLVITLIQFKVAGRWVYYESGD